MSAIQRPGALRDYFAVREENASLKRENAELHRVAAGLSERGHWLTNSAGLLGLGFVAGVVAGSVLVGAVAVIL